MYFQKDKKVLKDFENELHHLRKLYHHHIVQLVGSYTDPFFVGLIMSPIAEGNLKQYLNGPFEPSLVRTFFGCLTTAIRFLHESRVRHKDIKPENVLVNRGKVLLTDFGISRDWTDVGHSTTTGPTPMSKRYCAPEVGDSDPWNSSSDIWSLGCIFLEMWTVVSGYSLDSLVKHLESTGERCSFYHLNLTGIVSWYNLAWPAGSSSSGPLLWIQNTLKMNREERWTIQMLSDCIQEHSESSAISFIGLCCDNRIGSPETVNSIPDEQAIIEAKASDAFLLSATANSSVGSLDLGDLVLARSSRRSAPTSQRPIPSDRNSAITQLNSPKLRRSRKRRLAPTVAGSTNHKRRPSQPHESTKERESQPTGRDFRIVAGYKTAKDAGSHRRDRPLPDRVQKALPNSFLIAQNNRFTREEVLKLIPISYDLEFRASPSTRLSRGFEKAVFCYGDYMLPTVVYVETCIRSKSSQYARWSTLKSLVKHMTPAILCGYVRLCPDVSEGMASIPTIMPTGSSTDKVDGMLIFGFDESHAKGSRKYESKNEHDVKDSVTIELQNGSRMEVEATFRVWNEEQRDVLKPFEENWKPLHLVDGEWYSLMPESATAEDEELRDWIPSSNMSDNGKTSGRMTDFEQEIQEECLVVGSSTPQRLGSGDNERVINLTKNLISELFCGKVVHLASLFSFYTWALNAVVF
jgi:serine/threonine protein kinase